jgi:hypothetical protein
MARSCRSRHPWAVRPGWMLPSSFRLPMTFERFSRDDCDQDRLARRDHPRGVGFCTCCCRPYCSNSSGGRPGSRWPLCQLSASWLIRRPALIQRPLLLRCRRDGVVGCRLGIERRALSRPHRRPVVGRSRRSRDQGTEPGRPDDGVACLHQPVGWPRADRHPLLHAGQHDLARAGRAWEPRPLAYPVCSPGRRARLQPVNALRREARRR